MEIQIRRANISDLEFLFNLRNEEIVRRVSFNSDLIDLETHRKWFENRLIRDDNVIYIVEENSQPVAQVRFDLLDNGDGDVSAAIIKEFRGRGYGTEIFKRSALLFFSEFPKSKKIYGFPKIDNFASIRSLGNAGYKIIGEANHKGFTCLEMVLTR